MAFDPVVDQELQVIDLLLVDLPLQVVFQLLLVRALVIQLRAVKLGILEDHEAVVLALEDGDLV
jgi:hypothetical protein